MAIRSPIVLNSSPPDDFSLPSASPHLLTRKGSSSNNTSSSPQLPDASSFLRRSAAILKSGSRAQQLSQGIVNGFAPATGIWKTQTLTEAAVGEEGGGDQNDSKTNEDGGDAEKRRKPGRLVRPGNADNKSEHKEKKEYRPLKASPHTEPSTSAHNRSLAQASGSILCATNDTEALKGEQPESAPNSLPVFEFPDVEEGPVAKRRKAVSKKPPNPRAKGSTQISAMTAARKPQARTAVENPPCLVPPRTKSKKRFAKSESIILNSDEPDVEQELTTDFGRREGTQTIAENEQPIASNSAQALFNANAGDSLTNESTKRRKNKKLVLQPAGDTSCPPEPGPRIESDYFKERATVPTKAGVNTSAKICFSQQVEIEPVEDPRKHNGDVANASAVQECAEPEQFPSPLVASSRPPRSLPSLISGLSYTAAEANGQSVEREETGEALTKRRRIDLADVTLARESTRKASEVQTNQPAKRPRGSKKKPQTITALATKQYQAPESAEPSQPSVSAFLVPQHGQRVVQEVDRMTEDTATKPKRSRKPKVKKLDAEGQPIKQSKSSTARKKKVRTKEPDTFAPLYSPEKARAEERRQGFLFGTSSQLAEEQSHGFIREMQNALDASECLPLPQDASRDKPTSRLNVVRANHGTSIVIGQGTRDLWFSAARDHNGDVVHADPTSHLSKPGSETSSLHVPYKVLPQNGQQGPSAAISVTVSDDSAHAAKQIHTLDKEDSLQGHGNEIAKTVKGQIFVDLSHTSPISEDDSGVVLEYDLKPICEEREDPGDMYPSHPTSDDCWMLLDSDCPSPQLGPVSNEAAPPSLNSSPQSVVEPSLVKQPATSPIRQRHALKMLDANIGHSAITPPLKESPKTQQRAFVHKASELVSPRTPGRPRKASLEILEASPRPGRIPERPSEEEGEAFPGPAKPIASASASQLPASSSWLDVDEISDSEDTVTPSPPRRRPGSPPPVVQCLDFGKASSPFQRTVRPVYADSTLKATDLQWADVARELFPRITGAIRSTTPSTELNNPTWHEKILLYDPIVLEDLTSWLNGQNIGVKTRQLKRKSKGRAKKQKNVDLEESAYEDCIEEIKPWMVQKWCEENSVCCLWKEGLRGGVRTRY